MSSQTVIRPIVCHIIADNMIFSEKVRKKHAIAIFSTFFGFFYTKISHLIGNFAAPYQIEK
jgi:hypothetical protein